MGMSQIIRLQSAGEAETRKLPWGLQERVEMGAWPGEVSTLTQEVKNLCVCVCVCVCACACVHNNSLWNLHLQVSAFLARS